MRFAGFLNVLDRRFGSRSLFALGRKGKFFGCDYFLAGV